MKYTQTFNQFLNEQEEILNEDNSLALMVILQAAIVQGLLIGQMAANSSGDGFHPIDDLKAWWAKRKKDKAVQSIVDKLKDDPDVIAFMSLSNSAQRGKWYKLIEPKLNDEEKKYLTSISRTPFMNEDINEDAKLTTEIVKIFANTIEWGSEMQDRAYSKGGNLIFLNSFYYGEQAAMDDLKKAWSPGGTYYEYFTKDLKYQPEIVSTFSEFKATGRHKKYTDDGIVAVELSFEKI